jgi:hypothetical protein
MVPLAEALQRPIQRASLGHRADVIDVIGLGTTDDAHGIGGQPGRAPHPPRWGCVAGGPLRVPDFVQRPARRRGVISAPGRAGQCVLRAVPTATRDHSGAPVFLPRSRLSRAWVDCFLGHRREKTAFDPPVGRNFIGRLLELELRLGQCAIGGASGRALAGCWDPGDVHPKAVSERDAAARHSRWTPTRPSSRRWGGQPPTRPISCSARREDDDGR